MTRDHVLEGWVLARTPILPWRTVLDLGGACKSTTAEAVVREDDVLADVAMVRTWVASQLEDPVIREALFVASPDLLAAESHWRQDPDGKKGRRFEAAVYRYLQRMATRCTPFGMFAGVAMGSVGDGPTEITVGAPHEHRKWTRFDMDYLSLLCDHLVEDPEVRTRIRWQVNDSLYRIGDKFVYIGFEIDMESRVRNYKLRDASVTEALERVVSSALGPCTLGELAGIFDADEDNDQDAALAFVDELAGAQILLPELRPIVSGEHPVKELVSQLRHAGCERQATALEQAQGFIDALDCAGPGVQSEGYEKIAEHLRTSFPDVKAAIERLFQVDLQLKAKVHLDEGATIKTAKEALEVLLALDDGENYENPLASFIEAFRDRYEDQEIPLLEALDEEHGIGVRGRVGGTIKSEILAGIKLNNSPTRELFHGSPVRRLKLQWLLESAEHGYAPVHLSLLKIRNGLDPVGADEKGEAARLTGVLLQFTQEGVYFSHANSGVELLGRFSGMDEALLRGIKRLEAKCSRAVPGYTRAEIVHHPGGRIGNVLLRPRLHNRELVYLGRTDAPSEDCVTAADLLISVREGRVLLRRKDSEEFIYPILSNAHNTSNTVLGVYQFLNLIRFQDATSRSPSWHWGSELEQVARLPRVMVGDVILSLATWNIKIDKVGEIAKQPPACQMQWAAKFRKNAGLPAVVVLADHDNLLLVDFRNPLSVSSFLAAVGARTRVQLVEWIPPTGEHANEIYVPLFPDRASETRAKVEAASAVRRVFTERRVFEPGSEWLYLKFYAAPSIQERIVAERIDRLSRILLEAGHIDKWFFIRYQDKGGPHLRVRFHLLGESEVGPVLAHTRGSVVDLLESGSIHAMTLDSYRRELGRYAPELGLMDAAETIFCVDSELVTRLIMSSRKEDRWKVAVRSLVWYLTRFDLEAEGQLEFVRRARNEYLSEYKLESPLQLKPFGDFFRKHKSAGYGPSGLDNSTELERILKEAESKMAPAVESYVRCDRAVANDVLHSFIHMHLNRLFYSDQRAHEMAVYAYLARAMESDAARTAQKDDK